MGGRTTMLLAACALVGVVDGAGRAAEIVTPLRYASYFVAPPPNGSSSGTGSRARPWDLATALAGAGGRVQPGDTVWLLGGTYPGKFRTELAGTPEDRIIFRQYPGERATIDGTLRADGAFLTFWGFEIMQSDPGTYGLQANASESRFINLIIHDAGTQGVSFWNPGVNSELYGCIIYNNGTHENLDHGVYVHNESGTKRIVDNVFFNNMARGIQLYAGAKKNPVMRNVLVEGNVSFNNGTISSRSTRVNLLMSAKVPTVALVARDNLLYFSPETDGINIRVGNFQAMYNKALVLERNYAAGGRLGLQMALPWDRAVVQGNTFVGSTLVIEVGGANLSAAYRWEGNTYYRDPTAKAWRYGNAAYDLAGWQRASGLGATDGAVAAAPAALQVFVRPNKYEPGRAHIVIYNWGRKPTVPVDVSRVVRVGSHYEMRNVQDLFGRPVVSGIYQGGEIMIPMDGVAPPAPIGRVTPNPAPRTGPDFDVFVLTSAPR